MALVPANVLVSDSASDWIRFAIPLVLEQDLATSRNVIASVVNDESGAYQSGANDIVRTTIENRDSRITVQATITDLSTQKNREILRTEGRSSAGLLPVLNALTKQIDGRAVDFSTKSDHALQSFAMAAQSPNLQSRAEILGNAIRIDPTFGLAYLLLAETAERAGAQNVSTVIGEARRHTDAFTPFDRLRFQALAAQISHAPFAEQEKADLAVLNLAPNDMNALASVGSIRFLQNDANGGSRLYASALKLSPGNLNLRRQLAEGLLETRRFTDAEKVFTGLDNNAAVLPGLAVCILLEGDLARASTVFDKFIASRAPGDPLNPLFRAEWLALSGQVPKAIQSLQASSFNDRGIRALVLTQLTIWQLYAGDFNGAKGSARQAVQLDPRPTSFSAYAALLAAASEPKEQWQQQVNASPLNEQVKDSLLGYGFFLSGHFPEAAQSWQKAVQQAGNTDLRARAMLAASLDRAGNREQANKVVIEPFIPEFGDLYSAVSFNELHRLLGIGVR